MTEQAEQINAWMQRLSDGDRSAFSPLFRALWPPTRQLCLRMLGNASDADDAAQRALERVFEKASDYDPNRPAMPWVMGIAVWECRSQRQKKRRSKETALGDEHSVFDDTNPSDAFQQQQLFSMVSAAMGELRDVDKQTLMDAYWNESPGEAKDPAFRKRKERAVERIRAAWRRIYGID